MRWFPNLFSELTRSILFPSTPPPSAPPYFDSMGQYPPPRVDAGSSSSPNPGNRPMPMDNYRSSSGRSYHSEALDSWNYRGFEGSRNWGWDRQGAQAFENPAPRSNPAPAPNRPPNQPPAQTPNPGSPLPQGPSNPPNRPPTQHHDWLFRPFPSRPPAWFLPAQPQNPR